MSKSKVKCFNLGETAHSNKYGDAIVIKVLEGHREIFFKNTGHKAVKTITALKTHTFVDVEQRNIDKGLYVGAKHQTHSYGEFTIVSLDRSKRLCDVMFKNTGHVKRNVSLCSLNQKGYIRDDTVVKVGEEYKSKDGPIKVISDYYNKSALMYRVMFMNTGMDISAQRSDIIRGTIEDIRSERYGIAHGIFLRAGRVIETNQSGSFKILAVLARRVVVGEFEDTGYVRLVAPTSVYNHKVLDHSLKYLKVGTIHETSHGSAVVVDIPNKETRLMESEHHTSQFVVSCKELVFRMYRNASEKELKEFKIIK